MTTKHLLILTIACVLFGGCINVETTQHHTLPPTRKDKALIYFYREGRFEGSAVGHHLFENGHEIGSTKNGSFFYLYASPGEHVYELHVSLQQPMQRRVTLEVGKAYYMQTGMYVGAISSNMTFSIMNEQEGAAALDHLRMMNSEQ